MKVNNTNYLHAYRLRLYFKHAFCTRPIRAVHTKYVKKQKLPFYCNSIIRVHSKYKCILLHAQTKIYYTIVLGRLHVFHLFHSDIIIEFNLWWSFRKLSCCVVIISHFLYQIRCLRTKRQKLSILSKASLNTTKESRTILPHVVSIDFWQYKVEVEVNRSSADFLGGGQSFPRNFTTQTIVPPLL